jgi:hypothetical protein
MKYNTNCSLGILLVRYLGSLEDSNLVVGDLGSKLCYLIRVQGDLVEFFCIHGDLCLDRLLQVRQDEPC